MSGWFQYGVDEFRKRARIRVQIKREDIYRPRKQQPNVIFEVQNVGLTPSSINSSVRLKALLPRPDKCRNIVLRPHKFDFRLAPNSQVSLSPHIPVTLNAIVEERSQSALDRMPFMFFKTYTFSFTRGRKRRVRMLSADLVPVSWWYDAYKRVDFSIRGMYSLPKPPEIIDED